jgi:hypothetical protein
MIIPSMVYDILLCYGNLFRHVTHMFERMKKILLLILLTIARTVRGTLTFCALATANPKNTC